jgi:uncharacterized protein YndB with AHSA1/START domain
MPVTDVSKDPENLTLTVVADFPVPLRRLWDAYVDPRRLEKFWGPPEFPATFTRHDAFPGGLSTYVMTGADGSVHGGYWEWTEVKEPEGDVASFEVRDGFARPDGTPNPDLPSMSMTFWFESTANGSRVTTTTHFASTDDLARLMEMGMDEGLRSAMAQMDDVLADLTSFAAGRGVTLDVLSDTRIRISRVIRGSVEQVWRAHMEPELMRQWLLGPDGWVMTRCDWTTTVGETYRLGWARADGTEAFEFGGELRELEAPHRLVTTERMFGDDGPETLQVVTLTPLDEGTLLTQVHTYPDRATRDQALESGMVEGMEATYTRLEALLA